MKKRKPRKKNTNSSEVAKLKTKIELLEKSQNHYQHSVMRLSRDFGQVKQNLDQIEKKELNLEELGQKHRALLEFLKPDFITKIKNHELAIHTAKLSIDSIKYLQDALIEQVEKAKNKLKFFDYENVVRLNKETDKKLNKMKKLDYNIEKNTIKFEHLFAEFRQKYVEFKEMKGLASRLESLQEKSSERLSLLSESLEEYAKAKETDILKKQLKDINKRLKQCASKSDLKKIKKRKGGFSFGFS